MWEEVQVDWVVSMGKHRGGHIEIYSLIAKRGTLSMSTPMALYLGPSRRQGKSKVASLGIVVTAHPRRPRQWLSGQDFVPPLPRRLLKIREAVTTD